MKLNLSDNYLITMFDHSQKKNKTFDNPPHSRLFVVHIGDDISEQEFQENFETYGTVEQVYSVTDKNTGKKKGNIKVTI